jgi:hypothetical protein
MSNDELLTLDVDVLVPAALGDVLHARNAPEVRARLDRRGRQPPDDAGRRRGSSASAASPSCPTSWPTPAA